MPIPVVLLNFFLAILHSARKQVKEEKRLRVGRVGTKLRNGIMN